MPLNNVSVLLIDDEKDIVDLLMTFLSESGFSITGLTDPNEALDCIKKNSYDIVLTDLKMPFVSGMDIVKAVRATGHDTQIIIFTAFASIDSAIDAIQHGVYEYIRKPFKLQEIKILLERAAEKLYLKRENIALNKRIEKMLSNITMLYDISTILYQVPDFDMAIEMILDTVTEGMKVRKVGVLLYHESSREFRICNSQALSEKFVEQFRFQIDDRIENVSISLCEATIIPNIRNQILINDKSLNIDKDINKCVLIPIQYLEKTLGFLGVFQLDDDSLSLEDQVKLLKILATQIAPILQTVWSGSSKLQQGKQEYGSILYDAINESILTVKGMQSTVFFGFIRIVNCKVTPDLPTFQNMAMSIDSIIDDEFGSGVQIIWGSVDSILIISFGGSPISMELSCANTRKKVEDFFYHKNGNPMLSLKYVTASFPLDGNSPSEIINELGKRLFNEMAFSEEHY